jgi:hypothetical protein
MEYIFQSEKRRKKRGYSSVFAQIQRKIIEDSRKTKKG